MVCESDFLQDLPYAPTPQATEEAAWHASLGAAAAAVAAAGTTYSRLAPEEEVAPLVAQAQQLLQPKKDPDEGALGTGCWGVGRSWEDLNACVRRSLAHPSCMLSCRTTPAYRPAPPPTLCRAGAGTRQAHPRRRLLSRHGRAGLQPPGAGGHGRGGGASAAAGAHWWQARRGCGKGCGSCGSGGSRG